MLVVIQDPVRECYEWQKGNMRCESWAKMRKDELECIESAHIWHSQQERSISRLNMIIRQRSNDTEMQNLFSMMSEKISLVFYRERNYVVQKSIPNSV
jgi:hypothetical protein